MSDVREPGAVDEVGESPTKARKGKAGVSPAKADYQRRKGRRTVENVSRPGPIRDFPVFSSRTAARSVTSRVRNSRVRLLRISVPDAGPEVLVEERREVTAAEVAQAEVLRPVDDTRVLGDDAGVEFAREDE